MTQQEATNLVNQIYDSIFNTVTKAEPGGKPIAPGATTVLSLMKPGLAINPADYANAWTPGNLNGSQDAALNTARLADMAPKLSAIFEDSGNEISKIYGDIMDNVQVPKQPPNPAIDKQLDDAHAFLYRDVQTPDPDTGQLTTKTIETQVYRDYLDNQTAYTNARQAYIGAYLAAQATPAGKATWPMVAPTMQIPVKSAYDKWRAGFADKVEQNLAIMNTSSQNALSKAFNKAKALFDGYGVVLDETGTGAAPMAYRSSMIPSDWYSRDSASQWTTFSVTAGSSTSSSSSDFTSFGGSAGFSVGIFSFGASGSHSEQSQHASAETSGMNISFEYTMVSIRRPWANWAVVTGTTGWNLQNLYTKGKISTGTKNGQDQSLMPVVPMAFVVARNIKITANWAKSDMDFIKTTTSAGGSFGIGPFSIGGSYSGSHSKQTFTSSFAGGSIIAPGVQIIGTIGQLEPLLPPA
jgi:hypothetical protein